MANREELSSPAVGRTPDLRVPDAPLYHIVDVQASATIAERAPKHRLVEAARVLIEHVALLDGNLADEAVAPLTAMVADATAEVRRRPSLRSTGLADATGPDRVIAERSPYAGRANPLAPPMHIWVANGRTFATVRYGAAYEGPSGSAHGGVVAAAFDTLFGVAHRASGIAGVTGELTVRYLQPTPLGTLVRYEAWVDRSEGRKVSCRAESTADGKLLAVSSAIFVGRRSEAPDGQRGNLLA